MNLKLVSIGVFGEAAALEAAGEYETAARLLAPQWLGPGTEPDLAGLTSAQQAAMLLRAGSLTGWLGSKLQIDGAQELSKDLLTRACSLFVDLYDERGAAEADKCLATCYWREGGFDEVKVVLNRAASRLSSRDDLWLTIKLNYALAEWSAGVPRRALEIYESLLPLMTGASDSVHAMFHNGRALSRKQTGDIDGALIDYTAASYYFERAGHYRFKAKVDQNLGGLYLQTIEFDKAHQHLDRAEAVLKCIHDQGALAELWDTRSQVFFGQGSFYDAELWAGQSVAALESGEECSLLADSLVTHARALVQLQRHAEAMLQYHKAHMIAVSRISSERAAQIACAMLEDVAPQVCASAGLSIKDAIKRFEKSFMKQALSVSGGKVGEAARRLGITQQSLSWSLEHQYPDLRIAPKRKQSVTKLAAVKLRRKK